MVVHEMQHDSSRTVTGFNLGALEKGDYVRLALTPESAAKFGHIGCMIASDRGVLAVGFRELDADSAEHSYYPAEIISARKLAGATFNVLTHDEASDLGLPNHELYLPEAAAAA